MKATGTNTATTASVTASTARAISPVPFRAASQAVSPCSTCRTMFSMTTMASSMRRPMESVSASIVITLNVNPSACMTANVPMMAVGRATAATSVERALRRKRSTTSTARTPPRIMSSFTELMDARMNCEPSTTIAMRLPSGSCASIRPRLAFTASATATVFDPDCFRTTRPMAPFAAEPGAAARLGGAVDDLRHLPEPDRHAARARHDEGAERLHRARLAGELHRPLDAGLEGAAARHVHRLRPHRRDDVRGREAVALREHRGSP